MDLSKILNIIGVMLLIAEVWKLGDRAERFFRWARERVGDVGLELGFWVAGLLGIFAIAVGLIGYALEAMGVVDQQTLRSLLYDLRLPTSWFVLGLGLALWIAVALGTLRLVLWLLHLFPTGTLGAVGAIVAILSLVLDYL